MCVCVCGAGGGGGVVKAVLAAHLLRCVQWDLSVAHHVRAPAGARRLVTEQLQ